MGPNASIILTVAVLSLLLAAASAQSQYRPGGGPSGSGGFGGSSGGFGGDYDAGASDFGAGGGGGGSDLEENIPGVPGDDYPIFAEVPDTSFTCDGQVEGGYYADPEAECQVFHICAGDGTGGLTKYSFLCPNGTLFNQQYFVCDWWFNVDCSIAESLYALNDEIASEREANSPPGSLGDQSQYGGGQGGAGGRRGGGNRAGGQEQYGNGGNSGGRSQQNRNRNRSGGSQASASSPRGSYAAPVAAADSYSSAGSAAAPTYTFPEEFGFDSADSGYGAPAGDYGAPGGDYGAPAAEGYGAPEYSRRTGRRQGRRRPRQLAAAQELDTQEAAY